MEKFIKIPGLQHISEDILKLLDKIILIECRLVNSSWKTVLEQPGFWLRKFDFNLENLPLAVRNKWRCLAEELRNDELLKEFVLLMIKIYKGKENNLLKIAVRLKGGYTHPIQPNELKISRNSLKDTNKYQELIKFIIEHDNSNNKFNLVVSETKYHGTIVGDATTIHLAALFGFTEVLQKLNNKRHTPLDGWTGIGNYKYGYLCCFELAAMGGHLDTIKYLVSITDISIASNHESIQKSRLIPICTMQSKLYEYVIATARQAGYFEVAKFLEDTFSN